MRAARAFIASLNGQVRAECLTTPWFKNLHDAVRTCETRRRDDDEVRPHGTIGNRAPIELTDRSAARGPP